MNPVLRARWVAWARETAALITESASEVRAHLSEHAGEWIMEVGAWVAEPSFRRRMRAYLDQEQRS